MKQTILSLTFLAATLVAGASTNWTLQGREYTVDTLFHAQIGPGTTQTSLRLSGAQNLRVFYTTTDLNNPNVEMRVAQASKNVTGGAKLSTMQSASSRPGARHFAGVNADFFSGSQPIGSAVVNGDVWKATNVGWTSWYMTDDRQPAIFNLNFTGKAICGEASATIRGINIDRGEGALILYNTHRGSTTGTNPWGSETVLTPLDGATLGFVGTTRWTVKTAPSVQGEGGSTPIPSDGSIVLSGHGEAATFVRSLNVGDIVTLDLNTKLPVGTTVAQMASGCPAILRNGTTLDTQGALDHLTALNPRTAIGHSADGTKVVLLVVDGRQSGVSVGVVSRVLADIMREVGCADAMNFDGGGSSELYCSALGVRNRPSDGSERTVVNSVWAVSTAPDDDEIVSIAFMNNKMTLPKYGYYKPVIFGYNKYGMLVNTAVEGFTLSCDEALGHVTDSGDTLFADGEGYHALTATYGSATASIPVTIGSAQPEIRLSSVLLDSYHEYKTEVQATVEGQAMAIDAKALTWTSADASIATVDDEGTIRGISNGSTTVTGTVGSFSGSLPVSVEIPAKRHIPLDSDVDPANWIVAKTGLSEASVSALGKEGIAIDYTVSSTRGTSVTVKQVKRFYSRPDSVRIVINPGDASITKMAINLAPVGERPITYNMEKSLTPNANNVVLVALSDILDVKDFASYPVEFTSLAFYLGDGAKAVRRVEIPALEGVYDSVDESIDGVVRPTADVRLPRVAGRIVSLPCPDDARYNVFTTNGTCVMQGSGATLDASALAPGTYIITTADADTLTPYRIVLK